MKIVFGLFVAGMLLVSPMVSAGDGVVDDPAVTIDFHEDGQGGFLDSGWVNGQMWSARSSKNDLEYIGCGYRAVELDDGGGGIWVYKWGFCQARDVNGVNVFCFTENPELLDAMQATSAFAWIQFMFTEPDPEFFYHPESRPDGGRHCTRLGYSTQSFHLPEFTTKGNKASELGDD